MKLIYTFKISFLKLVVIAILIALSASIYAATTEKLNRNKWVKLTKDLSYQDDITKVQKENAQQSKNQTPKQKINFPTINLSSAAKIILILIVVLCIIYMISKFVTKGIAINKSVESLHYDAEIAEEKLLETDVDYLLNKAKNAKDWRLALRIYYLKMLKTLHEFNYVEWQIQKTNFQYNSELKNWNYLADWKNITKQYERSWYGEKFITEKEFIQQELILIQMIQQIKTQQSSVNT